MRLVRCWCDFIGICLFLYYFRLLDNVRFVFLCYFVLIIRAANLFLRQEFTLSRRIKYKFYGAKMNIKRKYYKSMSDIIFTNCDNGIEIERQEKSKIMLCRDFLVIL